MVVFDEILSDLLMQNNCVVIPSLGGFVANTVSAKVDVEKGIITPPSKALSFNRNLTNNDGLLVTTLSQKQCISYDEANDKVLTNVAQIKGQLNSGQRVHFQNVGFLYLNDAGKMAFEQDRFFNLLLASYGMGNVQFVPVEAEVEDSADQREINDQKQVASTTKKPMATSVENIQDTDTKVVSIDRSTQEHDQKPATTVRKTSVLRKVVKYAAVAALIPVAFYSFWIPMKTDVLQSGIVYTDDFNPFVERSKAKYVEGISEDPVRPDQIRLENELEKITSHLTVNTGEVFSYPLTEDDYVTVRYNGPVENNGETANQLQKDGYHLIVGCFREHENAENMIDQLNSSGWQGAIIDKHQGLHRVSAAVSSNKTEILEKRSIIESEGFKAWVLLK